MRPIAPLLVVLLAVAGLAQTASQDSSVPQQPGPHNNYGVPSAPKPGHALDPNDVAILTGKAGNSAASQPQYATPQLYYSYPTGGSMFSQSSVGYAFGQQPNFSLAYGDNWRSRRSPVGSWGSGPYFGGYSNFNASQVIANQYGGYSGFNGSQFADVSTEASPFHLRGRQKPGFGPTFFFGNRTPGFGNRWKPNLWSSPGAHFQAPTGSTSLPGLRP